MSGTKHTPGPWRVERESEGSTGWRGISIFSVDDLRIANMVMSLTDNELDNARLIAAAPELLAALQEVERYFDERSLDSELARAVSAAVAKAVGRTGKRKRQQQEGGNPS